MTVSEELVRIAAKLEAGELDPNEPMFPLFGHDLLGAGATTAWAVCARAIGTPQERVDSAMQTAEAMRAWKPKKIPGRPYGWKAKPK